MFFTQVYATILKCSYYHKYDEKHEIKKIQRGVQFTIDL